MTSSTEPRREPIDIDRDDVVQIRHVPYLLKYHEFLQLTKIHSFVAIWAHSFFAGTGVFLVTIVARLIDKYGFSGSSEVSKLEWITLSILVVLVIIFEGANWLLPSIKKTTAKKIQCHFDEHES